MLKNREFRERLIFRKNLILIFICMACVVLISNLYLLQIKNFKKYQLMSDKNRIRISLITPKRGRILSSDGKVLAFCVPKHRLLMDYCSKEVFEKNMRLLTKHLVFSEDERLTLSKQRNKKLPYIILKEDLSQDEYAKIAMNLFRLNGVYFSTSFTRNYYMPLEFCHLIGYTTKTNNEFQFLKGIAGIELMFDEQLCGNAGNIQKEIDASGHGIRVIDRESPVDGQDITLTVDSAVQKFVYDVLSQHKVAACCVLDISGKVLALVSVPGYDISVMSSGISQAQWNQLNSNMYKPLLNRFASATYPPGSVFKIVTAYAALKEGLVSPNEKILCLGETKQDNEVFHCWNRKGHGRIDIYDALSFSCDCYFFELAKRVGIQKLAKYAAELGFGQKTGVEIPNEKEGLVPDKKWKFLHHNGYWKTYETMLAGIGQGSVLANLLQTAVMIGKIYSNNLNFRPTLLAVNSDENARPLDKNISEVIKKGLLRVCSVGTARNSCYTAYGISGKTGSSQVRKLKSNEVGLNQSLIDWKYRDHAFFVGVAPNNFPKYIVAVCVEHGGGGASVAAPIARRIFDRLLQ